MTPSHPRSPDEESTVQSAQQRALEAWQRLSVAAQRVRAANAGLLAQGLAPVDVGEYPAPQSPRDTPTHELLALLEGQAQWYARETERLGQHLGTARNTAALAEEPPAALVRGPRPVPLALVFAEVVRGPWRWLRWLLFPPATMGAGVAVAFLAQASALAAAGVVLAVVAGLWAYGIAAGTARVRLLARAEVATVLQRTQRYRSVRNKNVPMLSARGWDVSVETFTGLSRQTEHVVQTSRGVVGNVSVVHGPEFRGVLLVDPETGRGCANLDLGSVPRPGIDGHWRASLPARVWITSALALALTAALLALVVYLASAELGR